MIAKSPKQTRIRIYPIPANGFRTIEVTYKEPLAFPNDFDLKYSLPLDMEFAVPSFSFKANVRFPNQPLVSPTSDLPKNEFLTDKEISDMFHYDFGSQNQK